MILIADSGSTKTQWVLIDAEKKIYETQGINPYVMDQSAIRLVIKEELLPQLPQTHLSGIHYYGAGCSSDANCRMIQTPLQEFFPQAKIIVEHDLLAAARSLCGHHPGIACIIGTGSNSCSYDGSSIVKNVRALGYILGDEGSGAYMGKKMLTDFLNLEMPPDIMMLLKEELKLNPENILDAIYKKPNPNRYMASFAKFIKDHEQNRYFADLIKSCLNDFFTKHILKYEHARNSPLHFVGSIAYYFQDNLLALAKEHKIQIGKILRSPMEGLIEYHIQ